MRRDILRQSRLSRHPPFAVGSPFRPTLEFEFAHKPPCFFKRTELPALGCSRSGPQPDPPAHPASAAVRFIWTRGNIIWPRALLRQLALAELSPIGLALKFKPAGKGLRFMERLERPACREVLGNSRPVAPVALVRRSLRPTRKPETAVSQAGLYLRLPTTHGAQVRRGVGFPPRAVAWPFPGGPVVSYTLNPLPLVYSFVQAPKAIGRRDWR
jgi:hypothetical protein